MRYLILALAFVAALAIASPAVGGPSLKKLVKKEVANAYVSGHNDDADFDIADSGLVIFEDSDSLANLVSGYEFDLWDEAGTVNILDSDGEHFGVGLNTVGADCRFFGYGA